MLLRGLDSMSEVKQNIEYFDPFIENGEQIFDPVSSHELITQRYLANDIDHDYSADEYVRDTQALMLDAQFLDRFEDARAIAARMHEICGENHDLTESVNANEAFHHTLIGMLGDNIDQRHSENKDDSKIDYEIDPLTGKKRKKKRKSIFDR